jgi:MFS family permease
MLGVAGIAMPVGPVIGGAIAESNWRWIFYLNLPFAAMAIVSVVFLMNITYKRSPTWKHAVARVDFVGSAIFIPSIVSVTYGLVSGGVVHPWGSYKVSLGRMQENKFGWAVLNVNADHTSSCTRVPGMGRISHSTRIRSRAKRPMATVLEPNVGIGISADILRVQFVYQPNM